MLSMGSDSCRGFSLWSDRSPLIAINTAWNVEARIFTLFHEYGHLLTRTNSACVEGIQSRTSARSDAVERWCEHFAAAVILPTQDLRGFLRAHGFAHGIDDFQVLRKVANHFKASLRATALRLIDLGTAGWSLYRSLPPASDQKTRGGGGGVERDRAQIRSDRYGIRTLELFASAVRRDVVSGSDVLDYLDLPPAAIQGFAGSARESGEID
jgi:Zn-dependent peptidase ImmA (M78 family)